jgi:hypothetical protein
MRPLSSNPITTKKTLQNKQVKDNTVKLGKNKSTLLFGSTGV